MASVWHLYGLCSLYGLCPPIITISLFARTSLRSLSPLRGSAPSPTLCPLYGPLPHLWLSILSMALCFLNSPLSPLQSSVPSIALCPFHGPLSSLQPNVPLHLYVPSTATLSPSTIFLPSTTHCPLYGALFPLWPSEPFTALCFLHSPLASL
jgi:hypothetical protein